MRRSSPATTSPTTTRTTATTASRNSSNILLHLHTKLFSTGMGPLPRVHERRNLAHYIPTHQAHSLVQSALFPFHVRAANTRPELHAHEDPHTPCCCVSRRSASLKNRCTTRSSHELVSVAHPYKKSFLYRHKWSSVPVTVLVGRRVADSRATRRIISPIAMVCRLAARWSVEER
ncbi:hypothetical protein BV25DRAFT_1718051 [Artomyces pyxidatus]|uniref:Uncharacterized protein n=1 Tax=Artomyces pyxidatus TaxID=48021 RepID=A0ACB8SI14_9AGAM|nr:hypothetical protein BV25DRAFT_1718051 [Artomyces pyxidatus]